MDTPGITVHQHRSLSGEIACTVFYDDVLVPDSARIGEANGGWQVITDALAGERVVMGGIAAVLLRQLDDLLAVVRGDPDSWSCPFGSRAAWRRRLRARAPAVGQVRGRRRDQRHPAGPDSAWTRASAMTAGGRLPPRTPGPGAPRR
jgi:alkylation response protein AidB-like acyl-CoA dehydrogenase